MTSARWWSWSAPATISEALAQSAPRRVRESDLEGHITHEQAGPGSATEAEGAEGAERAADLQLVRAVEVLKSWTYFERLREERRAAIVGAEATQATP